jgi:translation initiation factor IF-1
MIIKTTKHKMVKNTCGGNKHKGQARKVVNSNRQSYALRLSEDPAEVYAEVIKIYGGPLCSVQCIDKNVRNCVIRGKFRNKRDCIIKPGSWVLVGLRSDMSVKKDAVETCDLLEVYSDTDKEKLKKHDTSAIWNNLSSTTKSCNVLADEAMITFSDASTEEYENIMKNEILGENKKITLSIAFDQDEDEVNVDDI